MLFFLSLIPILLILYLMVGRGWGAARAGGAGYLSALLIAMLFFGAGPRLLAYAHARALILALDVLLIIWAAFFFYRVADEAGAIQAIAKALPALTPDTGMQALIIGWVFATFLQGVGGFGVPVAVTAPILASLNFSPLLAVLIPSIGTAWSVTFGSMGSSFQALISATGLPAEALSAPTAILLGAACLLSAPMVAHAAAGWSAVRRLWLPAIVLAVVMASVQYLLVTSGAWNLGTFGAGIAGLAVGIPIAFLTGRKPGNSVKLDSRRLIISLSGYAILITVILTAQFVPVVKSALGGVIIQIPFPETHTNLGYIIAASAGRKIAIFGHAGALLFYASLLSFLVYWMTGCTKPGSLFKILDGTVKRVMGTTVSILSMVTMSVIMEQVGMTDALARGLAVGMGAVFPAIAPWIGALGAFMTGSNTNSNVVFAPLQMKTAALLRYSIPVILAAQTAGASIGSVIAPNKVVVGTSTTGLAGKEGLVMRKMLVYIGLLLALMSILTVIGNYLQLRGP
jgi:lactate permease